MMSASRSGRSRKGARRAASWVRQLCVISGLDARDQVDRAHERRPTAALDGKHFAALRGQAVEPAAALAGTFGPASFNPAALLETVEEGIERRHGELERATGALLDQLADVVAVPRAVLDQRQNQQLGAAFLEFPGREPAAHMLLCNISGDGLTKQPIGRSVNRSTISIRWRRG